MKMIIMRGGVFGLLEQRRCGVDVLGGARVLGRVGEQALA